MGKLIRYVLPGIVLSGFLFPFFFKFWPILNTKNILAGLGVIYALITWIKRRELYIPKDILIMLILSLGVSLCSLLSIVVNNTVDVAYVSYVVSMAIWLSAANLVVNILKSCRGKSSVQLLVDYMIAVCVFQCVSALLIEFVPIVKSVVNSIIEQDQAFLEAVDRMYGIGASVDVAGTRFASVLVLMATITFKDSNTYSGARLLWYIVAFMIITVVGNMIARTTTVGLIIALVYILILQLNEILSHSIKAIRIFSQIFVVSVVLLVVIVTLYNNVSEVRDLLRFAFEGFFSLAEKGEWSVASNDKLMTMWVFPDNFKTWIIGDGYFNNPRNDPYFVGELTGGYYMGTDAGFSRFIFYFGLVGLLSFSIVFINSAIINARKYPKYKIAFLLLLCLNFIIWVKVSTDIFLVFALFMMLLPENQDSIRNFIEKNEDSV